MSNLDWLNVASCAQRRYKESGNPGDLETSMMAARIFLNAYKSYSDMLRPSSTEPPPEPYRGF